MIGKLFPKAFLISEILIARTWLFSSVINVYFLIYSSYKAI
jgi:hypothetical protein